MRIFKEDSGNERNLYTMLLWALATPLPSTKHNSKFEVKLTFAYKSDLCQWRLTVILTTEEQ